MPLKGSKGPREGETSEVDKGWLIKTNKQRPIKKNKDRNITLNKESNGKGLKEKDRPLLENLKTIRRPIKNRPLKYRVMRGTYRRNRRDQYRRTRKGP